MFISKILPGCAQYTLTTPMSSSFSKLHPLSQLILSLRIRNERTRRGYVLSQNYHLVECLAEVMQSEICPRFFSEQFQLLAIGSLQSRLWGWGISSRITIGFFEEGYWSWKRLPSIKCTKSMLWTSYFVHVRSRTPLSIDPVEQFHQIVNLFKNSVYSNSKPSFIEAWYHISSAISRNTRIINKNNNWPQFCFLESLYMKRLNPALSAGIKVIKELNLFR